MRTDHRQFIEKHRAKFWYTPEATKCEIGDDLHVGTMLNSGTLDDFRELRKIQTPQRLARVFFSATGRKAANYDPEIRHFCLLRQLQNPVAPRPPRSARGADPTGLCNCFLRNLRGQSPGNPTIVARGGNLLLLVNLDGQGAIPKVQEDRMLSIGKWLQANGEAIYSTRIVAPYSTEEVDYTRSKDGQRVYAIVKKSAREVTLGCALREGVAVRLLGSSTPLACRRDGTRVVMTLPAELSGNPLPFVLVCR